MTIILNNLKLGKQREFSFPKSLQEIFNHVQELRNIIGPRSRSIPQCFTCFYLQIPISRHLVPVTEQRSRFALFWSWRFRSDFSHLCKVRLLFVPLFLQQNMTSVAALAGIPTATGTKVSSQSRRGHVLLKFVGRIDCENGNGVWLPLKSASVIEVFAYRS